MRQIKHDCQPNSARRPDIHNRRFGKKKKKLPQKVKGKQFQDESLLVQGEREMLCVYVCGGVCVCV